MYVESLQSLNFWGTLKRIYIYDQYLLFLYFWGTLKYVYIISSVCKRDTEMYNFKDRPRL